MTYLATYVDPGLKVNFKDTQASITKAEIQRLQKLKALASVAETIPRRPGQEAEREDLAIDKKRCRRIFHVSKQCLRDWEAPDRNSAVSDREAHTIDWAKWWLDHQRWLERRCAYVATWQYHTGADQLWCKAVVLRLNNERRWLAYAMRD